MNDRTTTWRKSSYSGGGNECVELRGDLTAVRDSKNPEAGVLRVHMPSLLTAVRTGRFDR